MPYTERRVLFVCRGGAPGGCIGGGEACLSACALSGGNPKNGSVVEAAGEAIALRGEGRPAVVVAAVAV